MCYNLIALTLDELAYALHRGDAHLAEELERRLMEIEIRKNPIYFASGFAHPQILAFTNEEPMKPQLISWGLIPGWAKDWATADKLRKNTLNARVETMFDLASFKSSALSRRCLVYADAFYEYHTVGKKKYPFKISMRDGSPTAMAGLWSEWMNRETGELHRSFAIVTTDANQIMSKIHNLPAASDTPRMPLILPKERQDEWLLDIRTEEDKKYILGLAKPYPDEAMTAHPVAPLTGKEGVGNSIEATKPRQYEDLRLYF